MRIFFLTSFLFTACAWGDPFAAGQTLKREPVSQLEEIDGVWNEMGIACVNITTGKILKFVDTRGPSNKFTVDTQSHQFFESRSTTGWEDNQRTTPFTGNGIFEVHNSKIAILYLTPWCALPNPAMCGQYYEKKPIELFWINREWLGLQKQKGLPYFRCNQFPDAGALILYSRNQVS